MDKEKGFIEVCTPIISGPGKGVQMVPSFVFIEVLTTEITKIQRFKVIYLTKSTKIQFLYFYLRHVNSPLLIFYSTNT